jgi:hypothetical protein
LLLIQYIIQLTLLRVNYFYMQTVVLQPNRCRERVKRDANLLHHSWKLFFPISGLCFLIFCDAFSLQTRVQFILFYVYLWCGLIYFFPRFFFNNSMCDVFCILLVLVYFVIFFFNLPWKKGFYLCERINSQQKL